MPWNALMTPTTVPSSPTKGAVEPMVARAAMPFFRSVGGQRRRALNRPADGVHQVFAGQLAAALLLELVLLQSGQHHLREVAVAEVLGLRNSNRILEAAVLEVLGDLRGIEFRLVAGLREA